ncbi:High-affinity zinc uptake system membrane protein ZnuB [bacterium HR39]|nr:High-affinity zinc uptake system membrane protein ZnuB [bacterium HR39]
MSLTDPFLLRALVAALLFAAAAAPLGSFVMWRRMAYFGEALSHAVLLGVAAGLWLELAPTVALVPFVLLFGLLLRLLERHTRVPPDTLLAILGHGALASGLLALSLLGGWRTDLLAWLFGDVLAVGPVDLALLAGGLALVALFLRARWEKLLSATVSEELAVVEGVPVERVRIEFVLALALVVALGMRVVGMLLVMTLLLVPPAAVRGFVRTPEAMASGAILFALLAALLGLELAFTADLPAGPAIAFCAVLGFFLALPLARLWRSLREERP